jgi:hypothetical protein
MVASFFSPVRRVMGEALSVVDRRVPIRKKWSVSEKVDEARSREPVNVSAAEIPKEVVKAGRRLPTNDVAKARLELVLQCQPTELSQNRA